MNILDYDTVALDDEDSALVIIDQTKLPNRLDILRLHAQEEIRNAICLLQVRGAPAIGVAAGYGAYLAGKGFDTEDYAEFERRFFKASEYLNSARPTAVNLSWALNRMKDVVIAGRGGSVPDAKKALLAEARAIQQEDIDTCRRIGELALSLVKPGDGLLTHCNAGQLATSRYGTATAAMYLGHKQGYHFRIYCDETRPLLQGARLTAYELSSAGLDVTLLCDGMAASLMKQGKIQAVFTGCDRVAMRRIKSVRCPSPLLRNISVSRSTYVLHLRPSIWDRKRGRISKSKNVLHRRSLRCGIGSAWHRRISKCSIPLLT